MARRCFWLTVRTRSWSLADVPTSSVVPGCETLQCVRPGSSQSRLARCVLTPGTVSALGRSPEAPMPPEAIGAASPLPACQHRMGPGVSELRPDPALLPDPDPDAAVAADDHDEAALREAIRNQHHERYRNLAGKGCLGPATA